MTNTVIFYLILYGGVLAFVVASVVRAVGYAKLPLHLRWELYPVPHEEKERAKHGGSYFELKEWWTQPLDFNRSGELGAMAGEIFFLEGLREFKRRLWYRSYPFHVGLYLAACATGLLLLSALLSIVAPGAWTGGAGPILHNFYLVIGLLAAGLIFVGGTALLIERLTAEDLKTYTTAGDIFNLSFFIVTVGFLLFGYFSRPAKSLGALALLRGTLTFDTSVRIPILLEVGLIVGILLLAYIPMTHMSHFIAKYFTYHSVRWDDRPNRRGSGVEKKVAEYLTYRPTWAAGHIGADGSRSWAQIATTDPAQGGKK